MKAPVNSRYSHCDGITDIALYEAGEDEKILTCGSDGDIRMWVNPEDQKPAEFSASDGCLAICCHKNTVYVGTENNTVEMFSLPAGDSKKVVTKFTAAVNHVDVSKSGDILVAGSGDMTIQIIKLSEDSSSSPVKIEGHSAPVLSVRINPTEEYVISTGCDGCVCIWDLTGKQLKSWDKVFQSSNDISISKTLCRPSWSSEEKFLAVPEKSNVVLYSVGDWKEVKTLKTSANKMLSVTLFSNCGKYIAAGSTDGTLFVWNVDSGALVYENVDTKDHISGLVFSKSGKDIIAVDLKGRMIYVNDFLSSFDTQELDLDDELGADIDGTVEDGAVAEEDPFDDDMDDMLIDDEDVEGNEISISNIKAMAGFIASEKEDVFVGVDKAKKMAGIKTAPDDDAVSVSSRAESHSSHHFRETKPQHRPAPIEIPITEPQKAFQPSSSPVHLQHRFMVWNSIGLVRNYELDDDDLDAIDIEFHDVSFHSGIHLRNQHNYTLAALGREAIIFASPKQSDSPSKIMCLHFSSWENNKEWTTELPKHEEATTLAIGSGWFAVGTNMNRVRIFSTGGVQRNLVDLGGQIIAISGHEDLLFVTYHTGIGLHGNQCISFSLIRVRISTGLFPLISSEPLPLSPKSELSWIGFSDEGTPSFSDSKDSVRILNGRLWTTFLNMKESSRNDSDHYWVTGLSVCSQHIRTIKCKGTRYPPTLPRPTILLLDTKLPLCEMETEKSQLEDVLCRSILQSSVTKKMDKKGFDVEEYKDKAEKDIKETLMKLFAMCCKADKDFRASDYVTMMPSSHSVHVAIKYANKLRKMALTERLQAIGRKKLDEEEEGLEEDDDDFENMRTGNIIYSSVYSTLGANSTSTGFGDSSNMDSFSNSFSTNNKSSSEVEFLAENPLLTRQRAELQSLSKSSVYRNPFKKDGGVESPSSISNADASKFESESGKGLSLIDAWKKPVEKPTMEFNPKHPKSKAASKKALEKGDKNSSTVQKGDKNASTVPKNQPTLFAMTGRKAASAKDKDPNSFVDSLNADENSNSSTNGLASDSDSKENNTTEKKRKRSDDDTEAEKKSRIGSRLAAFALKRKEPVEDNNDLEDI